MFVEIDTKPLVRQSCTKNSTSMEQSWFTFQVEFYGNFDRKKCFEI